MTSSTDGTIDLRYYFRILWLRKGILLLCTITVICTTVITMTLMPETYESSITVLITGRRPLAAELEGLIGGRTRTPDFREEKRQLAELQARIRSYPFLERVISRLQMDRDPVIREKAVEEQRKRPEIPVEEMAVRLVIDKLRPGIRVSAKDGTYTVVASAYSAENSFRLANTIGQVLDETRKQTASALLKSAQTFGVENLRLYEQRFRAAVDSLEAFKGELIRLGLEQGVVNSDNLARANHLEQLIQSDLAEAKGRVAAVSDADHLARHVSALSEDGEISGIGERLRTALTGAITDQLSVANSTEPPSWPPNGGYSSLRRELLRRLRTRAAQKLPNMSSEQIDQIATFAFLQEDVDATSAAAASLAESIQSFKLRAQSQPVHEMELARLESEVDMYRKLLDTFRAQTVAADINQSVGLTSLAERLEIVSPAKIPFEPSRPNKIKLMIAAFILGPAIGAAAAFLSLLVDPTSRSLDEFSRIVPEPVLGTIPLLRTLKPRHRGLRRYWVPAAVGSVLLMTAAFFVFKSSLERNLTDLGRPIRIVEPGVDSQ